MTVTASADEHGRSRASDSSRLGAGGTWPDDSAREWTLELLAKAQRETAITAVVLTGSAARCVAESDDLDLVIVYEQHRPSLSRAPISVDLRLYEQSEVLQGLSEGHDYLTWTVRYGRALLDRQLWWANVCKDWRDRLTLPSSSQARERAQKAQRRRDEMLMIGDDDAAADLELSMLTFLGRAALSDAGVFPKSRPEIPSQLDTIGANELSERLSRALEHRNGTSQTSANTALAEASNL